MSHERIKRDVRAREAKGKEEMENVCHIIKQRAQ